MAGARKGEKVMKEFDQLVDEAREINKKTLQGIYEKGEQRYAILYGKRDLIVKYIGNERIEPQMMNPTGQGCYNHNVVHMTATNATKEKLWQAQNEIQGIANKIGQMGKTDIVLLDPKRIPNEYLVIEINTGFRWIV